MDKPITGFIEVTPEGWLYIRLDTLLPHCRYGSVAAIYDAITALLSGIREQLPSFEKAFLIIDEHSDESNRRVFDQDNKAWKAIPNALKGWVFADDDQDTLSICLLSKKSPEGVCHVWVLPDDDIFYYIGLRCKDRLTYPQQIN